MAENNICPYCQTPNQEGDKFCLDCGRPLGGESTLILPDAENAENDAVKDSTEPLSKNTSFLPRPIRAIFGGRFLANSLIHSDDAQHGYIVTEVTKNINNRIKGCTNPGCGAVHLPLGEESERYCTYCGAPLSSDHLVLTLFEARTQIFGNAARIPELSLTHAGIRVPIAAFHEKVAGEDRFCLVTPYTETFASAVERDQVFRWAPILASAFNYLHHNGITFKGEFGEEAFSLSNGNAVIASFYNCQVGDRVSDAARVADLQGLAGVLFKWLTGRKEYAHDPALSPALNHFFETAMNHPGFSTAETFAQAFDEAAHPKGESRPVDHKLGRLTDVGVSRSLNEDSLLTIQVDKFLESLPQPLGVYVVADGMGGHSAGEVASGTIINTIAEYAFSNWTASDGKETPQDRCQWMDDAIQKANKAVFDLGRKMSSDMGSTIVMAVVEGNQVCIGHVGDSRAYRVNSKGITPLTTDHSLVERLVDTGQITREEARNHPQRNVIYRTLGDKAKVEVETSSHTMELGDRLLLCSDGLNGMVDDDAIRRIIMEDGLSPQDACERLVQAANAAGGDDNITVVLLQFV